MFTSCWAFYVCYLVTSSHPMLETISRKPQWVTRHHVASRSPAPSRWLLAPLPSTTRSTWVHTVPPFALECWQSGNYQALLSNNYFSKTSLEKFVSWEVTWTWRGRNLLSSYCVSHEGLESLRSETGAAGSPQTCGRWWPAVGISKHGPTALCRPPCPHPSRPLKQGMRECPNVRHVSCCRRVTVPDTGDPFYTRWSWEAARTDLTLPL